MQGYPRVKLSVLPGPRFGMRSRGERIGAVSGPVSERTGARELSRAGQMILLRERDRARVRILRHGWRGAAGLIRLVQGVLGSQIAADPGGAGEGSGVRASVLGWPLIAGEFRCARRIRASQVAGNRSAVNGQVRHGVGRR